MSGIRHPGREHGFTLVELLVTLLIMAILAAIAVPLFLRQRDRGYAAQMQSALKGAAVAAEDFAVDQYGSYAGLDGDTGPLLAQHGFTRPSWANVLTVEATGTAFCITMRHSRASVGEPWHVATYVSSEGKPNFINTCPP